MSLVTFDETIDHKFAPYSEGEGTVLRSEHFEVYRIRYPEGKGSEAHRHPEEQLAFVISGRMIVTAGGETYEVGPGQASFHPSNIEHGVEALEDTLVLSIKTPLSSDDYEAHGKLE